MLGQPVSMLLPQVVGFRLEGELPEGSTATDLVLTVTEMLRERGVVGKFVEFYGPGLANLPLADRATIGNMSPEFGSTCAIFPVDAETLRYLEFSGRPAEQIELVEAYTKRAGPLPRRGLRGRHLLRHARARPLDRRALAGRPQAPAGPRRAVERRHGLPGRAGRPGGRQERRPRRQRLAPVLPRERPAGLDGRPGRGRGRRPARARPRLGGRGGRAARERQGVARRRGVRPGGRRGGDRRDHQLHEHLQPLGHARRGHPRPQRGGARPEAQAVGEDLARARLEGRDRLPRPRRAHRAAEASSASTSSATAAPPASATPGPLPGRDLGGDRGRGPHRLLGAVGQPQLRGPHPPRGEDELPRLAAAVRGLRAGRADGPRHRGGPARRGRRRRARLPARPLADAGGGERRDRVGDRVRHVPQELRRGVRGRRELGVAGDPRGRPLRVGRGLHLREAPALLRGHAGRRRRRASTRSRARAGDRPARRQRDHRPHLTGRRDQEGHARRRST